MSAIRLLLPWLAMFATAATLPGQGKILYPNVRFRYAYPSAPVRAVRLSDSVLEHTAYPARSIRELNAWPIPVPPQRLSTFGGDGWLLVKADTPHENTTNFWGFTIELAEGGHGHKVEVGHHRTDVWGLVHAWKYLEWGGDGDRIPGDYPVWAMYEAIFAGCGPGDGIFSTTNSYRISHVRQSGAGEAFAGELAEYRGPGTDPAGRKGLEFRRRTIHFGVDVALGGSTPTVTWSRGPTRQPWQAESVHTIVHTADWRRQVDELRGDAPPPRPMESELFCYLGRPERGLKPAQVSSILDLKGWPARRAKGLRPALTIGGKRGNAFEPKLDKRGGLVRRAGQGFVFECRELGIRAPLEVPEDLQPLLAAWVANFP